MDLDTAAANEAAKTTPVVAPVATAGNGDALATPSGDKPKFFSLAWWAALVVYVRASLRVREVRELIVLCVAATLLNSDTNLLAPTMLAVGEEFNMTDIERDTKIGGWIPLGFFIVGGTATILVGYFADRVHRVRLLAAVMILGETSCLMTVAVYDYWSLFATRSLTGIAIGGALPLMYSLVGDMFYEDKRGKAIAAINITSSLGIAIGQSLAGVMGPSLGWRSPFVAVSVPSLILAPILLIAVREPPRGAKEAGNEDGASIVSEKVSPLKVLELAKAPTVVMIWIQGIPGSLPWGVILTFFQTYVVQVTASSPNPITVAESTIVVLAFGAGAGLGVIVGGIMYDKLWKIKYEYVPLYMGTTTMIGALPVYGVLNAGPLPLGLYAAAVFPSGFLATMTGSCVKPMLLNVCIPNLRGAAVGLQTFTDDLGKGLGPFWVSLIIAQVNGDRKTAFNIALAGWFVCAMVLYSMLLTVRRDANKQKEMVLAAIMRNADAGKVLGVGGGGGGMGNNGVAP